MHFHSVLAVNGLHFYDSSTLSTVIFFILLTVGVVTRMIDASTAYMHAVALTRAYSTAYTYDTHMRHTYILSYMYARVKATLIVSILQCWLTRHATDTRRNFHFAPSRLIIATEMDTISFEACRRIK
jgi:hypothetical protein